MEQDQDNWWEGLFETREEAEAYAAEIEKIANQREAQQNPTTLRDVDANYYANKLKGYRKIDIIPKYPELNLKMRMTKDQMFRKIADYKRYKPTQASNMNMLFNPTTENQKLIDKVIDEYLIKRENEEQVQAKLLRDQRFKQAIKNSEVDIREFHLKRIYFTDDDDHESNDQLAENFKELCDNAPKDSRILVKLYTDNGDEIYMQLNEEQIEWISQIIKNDGKFFPNPNDYEGYTDETTLTGIKIIDIDQLPEEKRRAARRLYAGFPYVHIVKHSPYTKYQIYGYEDVRDDENCFVHSLRVSKLVPDDKMASISARIGMLPYIGYSGVDFIAKEFHLNICVTVIYPQFLTESETYRKYKEFRYGENEPVIKLGAINKHFVFNEEITPNADTLKHISDLFRKNQIKPIRCGDIIKQDIKLVFDWAENDVRPYKTESDHPMARFYSKIKDLYQVGGNLEKIIRQCLRGGRCLIAQKKCHVREEIVDLDVNALYPYAMSKLFIQCGTPKKMPSFWTLEYILKHIDNEISQAFMEIEITEIGIKRKFPVITGLDKGYYWVDTITLQDLIRFHEIKARFVRGIYYDGKRDYSIQKFILDLYHKRRMFEITDQWDEAKQVKLMMNKIYGYACQLPRPMKFEEMSSKDVEDFMIANYGVAPKAFPDEENPGMSKVQMFKEWTNSYNMCNCAVYICSMARHIMNELLYKCEDHNIEVFYSDTDSLFIRRDDLDKLNSFYNYELIGDELGQLKNDLDDDFEYAQEAIFLAKKQYCLKLDDTHYHIRRAFISNEKLNKDVWRFFKRSCGEH